MGSICSKSSHTTGEHQVLGSATGGGAAKPSDPRAAALAAAEARAKAAEQRGVNRNNPNAGKLAAQANKPAKFTPEPRQEERLVWD
ncbi:hypothetical protein K523DRAFT_291082 [Schizophyllum commune Tattone D]|nr:hypothetical protein K525DRAFT_217974 [Schizophyllum commune Loenen D]KAI5835517.1 hypothetical protein K523DRAFT_291082 [Schizophyllum commune Tattone D]